MEELQKYWFPFYNFLINADFFRFCILILKEMTAKIFFTATDFTATASTFFLKIIGKWKSFFIRRDIKVCMIKINTSFLVIIVYSELQKSYNANDDINRFLIKAFSSPSYIWIVKWVPATARGGPAKLKNGELQGQSEDCQENSSEDDDEDSSDIVDRNATIASILVLTSTDLKDTFIEIYYYWLKCHLLLRIVSPPFLLQHF